MSLGRLAMLGYILFLAFYSWYKYSVAAPPAFSAGYAQSVVILVLMTGFAPFVVVWGLLKFLRLKRLPASIAGAVMGVIFCVAGYVVFWWFFIAPGGAAPAVYDVAIRGVGWGALQGGLAAIAANH